MAPPLPRTHPFHRGEGGWWVMTMTMAGGVGGGTRNLEHTYIYIYIYPYLLLQHLWLWEISFRLLRCKSDYKRCRVRCSQKLVTFGFKVLHRQTLLNMWNFGKCLWGTWEIARNRSWALPSKGIALFRGGHSCDCSVPGELFQDNHMPLLHHVSKARKEVDDVKHLEEVIPGKGSFVDRLCVLKCMAIYWHRNQILPSVSPKHLQLRDSRQHEGMPSGEVTRNWHRWRWRFLGVWEMDVERSNCSIGIAKPGY